MFLKKNSSGSKKRVVNNGLVENIFFDEGELDGKVMINFLREVQDFQRQ